MIAMGIAQSRIFCLLAGFAICLLIVHAGTPAPAPAWWQQLDVRGLDNEPLVPVGRWVVLVFISPECPLANASVPLLNALAQEFAPRGFYFVGIYADPNISPVTLRQHARDYALAFATADDRAHRLVRATGAVYTPEVFVFTREGKPLYHGRIDDRVEDFGAARPAAVHQDLRDVLTALIAGQPGPFAERHGFGCAIPEAVK